MRVRLVENYSVELTKAHPNDIFIFGDNVVRKGVAHGAGQAVIRYQPNAFGIATKRAPSTEESAYFSDSEEDIQAVEADLRALYKLSRRHTLVFPSGGIGTGRAQMKQRSPKAWARMNQILRDHFGIENGFKARLTEPGLEP
ncbi:hypothetical protein IFT48_04735 [Pseudomonas fluorescens]|uniref:DUF7831 domain-containing protein n=1 Tax=Pseudomonas TaxID=286 RepID=UPI000F035D35|nr:MULTISPECIES: hypothetical protein [Pseudomonas]MBD8089280.1 hypothetical protein [Pseudomonas fluorescens]MBD8615293.1 hypothetical protein [Pseudomonas putida]MBD8682053.1 hypothetical protein [Pseudomonas sp. CFBP 13719]